MKKLLLLLTVFTLTFYSCDNDDDDLDLLESPYAGTWSGTYTGDDTGTWIIEISKSGEFIKGSSYSHNARRTQGYKSVTINADGSSTSVAENGTIGTGQFTEDNTSTGTWHNPNNNLRGISRGSKK